MAKKRSLIEAMDEIDMLPEDKQAEALRKLRKKQESGKTEYVLYKKRDEIYD